MEAHPVQFSYTFPAIKGIQAGRNYYTVMVPLKLLSKIFVSDSEEVSPEFRAQRRLNESRIPAIKKYIIDNRDNYVFSALAASIDGQFEFEPYPGQIDIGLLKIDMDAIFLINDGQHRKAAIEAALKEDSSLGAETISIVLYEDHELKRSQQMFTDLNKHAVRTSNSLATLYDSRDEMSVLLKDVMAAVPFLNTYTDKERDILGANSAKLFTLNNIYKANALIVNRGTINDKDRVFLIRYWNTLISNIIEWQELQRKELSKKALRQDYILCLNITILAFGHLGAYFYENPKVNISKSLAKLKQINWSRSDQRWLGRAIRENGKVITGDSAAILICNEIKNVLGIPLTKDDMNKEKKLLGRSNQRS